MEKETAHEMSGYQTINFTNILSEIYKLLPVDNFVKLLSSEIEPPVLFKFKEAEDIVRCRCGDRPCASSSEDLSTSREFQNVDLSYACTCISSVLDVTWEALNTGHWSNVPVFRRQLYTAASFVKVLAVLQSTSTRAQVSSDNTISDSENYRKINEALRTTDMGLLLGAPLASPDISLLQKAAKLLSSALVDGSDESTSSQQMDGSHSAEQKDKVIGGVKGQEVLRLRRPSLEKFRLGHFDPRIPVILTDCIGHWPAVTRWSDIGYLRRVAGARLVPVELGSRYTDEEWSQKLMTVGEFIETYIYKTAVREESDIGYLAQHPLFEQVPELLSDIREPEYCCISDADLGDEEETDINAWFGPEGTVSPLHYDPKHNLLAQVVGSKRILLYSPDDSALLFPHEDKLLSNTSRVDPERPDFVRFPGYEDARAWECRLNSTEMLYIPPRWWHHVRSLETSFSVSFWWQ